MTPAAGTPLLGCIADDFTGATDLAGMLVRAGMRTVQMIGVPAPSQSGAAADGADALTAGTDAIVVALKSRTTPAGIAVAESLAALRWLQAAGCRQFLFKYCSTFDSTDAGNIGPVIDALMTALACDFTIACPAFPENRRTVFQGHLFVGTSLLSESGMQDHPLTPMRDPNLVRVLQRQTQRKVGLLDQATVAAGVAAIARAIDRLRQEGVAIAIADAVCNADLVALGAACGQLPLITGGSGIALGLPQNFSLPGGSAQASADSLPATPGLRAIVSGSCSQATQAQVAHWIAAGGAAFAIDALRIAAGDDLVAEALAWAMPRLATAPVLVYATADAATVRSAQAALGVDQAGALVEATLAAVARGLVAQGVRQMLVAGGETSGAVVSALGIDGLRIGVQIDPGVPWTVSLRTQSRSPSQSCLPLDSQSSPLSSAQSAPLSLALKSGNFGSVDFFSKAWKLLP